MLRSSIRVQCQRNLSRYAYQIDIGSKISTSVQARQDLAQMGTLAGNAGRKLSSMAQSFMKDLQGSY